MKIVVTLGIIAAGVLVGGMFLGYSIFVYADRDDNDENGETVACDPSHVQHWDKIAFQFSPDSGTLEDLSHSQLRMLTGILYSCLTRSIV